MLGLIGAYALTRQQALKDREPFWSPPTKRVTLALVPPLALVSIAIMVPTVLALILMAWFGKETRGRDLRELDPGGDTFAATGM